MSEGTIPTEKKPGCYSWQGNKWEGLCILAELCYPTTNHMTAKGKVKVP